MHLRYSEYYKINKSAFEKLGVFNGFILHDSQYFLNPKLIEKTENKFFTDCDKKIKNKFSKIIKLIDYVNKPDYKSDMYYKAAVDAIISPENGYIGLGYSSAGKKGRGIGKKLAESIAHTCYRLIKVDEIEPDLFVLLGVFKENISVDRISDMIINIIETDILIYTENIASKLNVPTKFYKGYNIPFNKFDNNPLFFLPTELLSKLPVWDEMFYEVIDENKDVLEFMNEKFGEEYYDYITKKEYREAAIVENRKILNELIEKYKNLKEEAYDFKNDPSNDFLWIDKILELVEKNPINLNNNQTVEEVTFEICNKFKDLIENTNAYKLLYQDGNRKRHESASQQAFQLFAHSYCDTSNLDMSPESNGGRGPIDFKFSQGKNKVLVELKLSSSKDLKHCLETQIEIYEKSEGTSKSIMLVLLIGNDEKKALKNIENLINFKNELSEKGKKTSDIIVVDALVKKSASKA